MLIVTGGLAMVIERAHPESDSLTIPIPQEYIGKDIEIRIDISKPKVGKFRRYFGIMRTPDLETGIAAIRSEWSNRL
jgi:hypothetical protein